MKDRPVLAGYCGGGELSGIAREDVCMLTHINVAVGSVSEGKAAVLWDAREEDMERLRAWNPELQRGLFRRLRRGSGNKAPCKGNGGAHPDRRV